jgi:hypothetical protein
MIEQTIISKSQMIDAICYAFSETAELFRTLGINVRNLIQAMRQTVISQMYSESELRHWTTAATLLVASSGQ